MASREESKGLEANSQVASISSVQDAVQIKEEPTNLQPDNVSFYLLNNLKFLNTTIFFLILNL